MTFSTGMSMMQVSARLDNASWDERRAGRHRANLMAVIRRQKHANETIQIVDISVDGCGFRSRRPMPVGARLWLGLPGLETWAATVAWFEDGQGGLRFERPLHPRDLAEALSTDPPRPGAISELGDLSPETMVTESVGWAAARPEPPRMAFPERLLAFTVREKGAVAQASGSILRWLSAQSRRKRD